MSTDWHVHCLDCAETHTFDDANWRDDDMALICKHAAAIAALAPLVSESGIAVELRTAFGRIDTEWFLKHAPHKLVPISEYGAFMEQCAEYVTCACGSTRRCALNVGHDGDHDPQRRAAAVTAAG